MNSVSRGLSKLQEIFQRQFNKAVRKFLLNSIELVKLDLQREKNVTNVKLIVDEIALQTKITIENVHLTQLQKCMLIGLQ